MEALALLTPEDSLPAGDFSAWLQDARRALITGGATDVPCGTCTACCASSYFIHIRPDETAALARIDRKTLAPARGLPKGHVVMGYDEEGACPQMRGGACAIYADRPGTCRAYDCRVFAAAGLSAGEDKPRVDARVEQWRFGYPTTRDREEHEAVRAAARFIREHAALFPGGKIPEDPSRLAVLALKVYAVFLREPGPASDPAETARAVVEALRSFDAG